MRLTPIHFVCFILLIAILATPTPGCFASSAASKDYDAGYQLYRKGKYKQAAAYLERSCSVDSVDKAEAHYLLANCYIHMKNIDEAIKHYKMSYITDQTGLHAYHCIQALKRLRELKRKAGNLKSQNADSKDSEKDEKKPTESEMPPEVESVVRDEYGNVEATREQLIADKVNNLIGRANDLITKKQFKEGEKLLTRAVHAADNLGSASEPLSKALTALANYQDINGNFLKAVKLHERQFKVSSSLYGRYSEETAMVSRALAISYVNSGQYGLAIEAYREYVSEWEELHRRWESTRLKKYKDARKNLLQAYREAAEFHARHGYDNESDRYNDLASALSRSR